MTEREMEDLLWNYPERFLSEPLRQYRRQPASKDIGRADLVFKDASDEFVIMELKKGMLE